jgi:hypothetical protein
MVSRFAGRWALGHCGPMTTSRAPGARLRIVWYVAVAAVPTDAGAIVWSLTDPNTITVCDSGAVICARTGNVCPPALFT